MTNSIRLYPPKRLRKGLIPLLLLALLSTPAAAQKLEVVSARVNAGRTAYREPVSADFEFRVKGGRKFRVEAVKPDCNCVTVSYPKGETGDRFHITMTYDARQLGHFSQQAAVISNGTSKPLYITMYGQVLENYVSHGRKYPVKMGELRLDKADLEFDDVNSGDTLIQDIHLYNNGFTSCQPNLMHLPPYLTAVMQPETLPPDETGTITVRLSSSLLRDYGLTRSTVYLAANPGDKVSRDNAIECSAVLLPSFAGLDREQLLRAPRIELSGEDIRVDMSNSKRQRSVITISNTGQQELDISSLELFSTGLKVSLNHTRIKPGGTAQLSVTALPEELRKARNRLRILMITNDPTRPKVVINILTNSETR